MREKLYLALKRYGTVVHAWNQFSCTYLGKDSCGVESSLPLSYFITY